MQCWKELESIGIHKATIESMATPQAISTFFAAKRMQGKCYAQGEPVSNEIKELVQHVCNDCGIKDDIIVLPWKSPMQAAMTSNVMLINEHEIKQLPRCSQKFMIAHELMHYKNKELFFIETIHDQCIPPHTNFNDHDHPLNKLCRFYEIRADIEAALTGPEYAEGNLYLTSMELKENGEQGNLKHPPFSIRLAQAQDVINRLAIQPTIVYS